MKHWVDIVLFSMQTIFPHFCYILLSVKHASIFILLCGERHFTSPYKIFLNNQMFDHKMEGKVFRVEIQFKELSTIGCAEIF